jgi:hypothetical protein
MPEQSSFGQSREPFDPVCYCLVDPRCWSSRNSCDSSKCISISLRAPLVTFCARCMARDSLSGQARCSDIYIRNHCSSSHHLVTFSEDVNYGNPAPLAALLVPDTGPLSLQDLCDLAPLPTAQRLQTLVSVVSGFCSLHTSRLRRAFRRRKCRCIRWPVLCMRCFSEMC